MLHHFNPQGRETHMQTQLLGDRLNHIRRELEAASGGRYAPPEIIAVTKNHPAEEILPLEGLGVKCIGENRVQEIVQKLPQLEGRDFRIHLIGRLQTNKVKYIIDQVCMIQSVDRLPLAQEIDRQACKRGLQMPVLIQVSPAGEEQKGGIAPEDLRPFLKEVGQMQGLSVRGLMAIMPNTQDEAYLSGLFAGMRTLFEELREESIPGVTMEHLSMGMSGDYLLAARHGATMVRIGSALMGPRDYSR